MRTPAYIMLSLCAAALGTSTQAQEFLWPGVMLGLVAGGMFVIDAMFSALKAHDLQKVHADFVALAQTVAQMRAAVEARADTLEQRVEALQKQNALRALG